MELRRLILSLGWVVFSIHFARPYSNSLGVNASSSAIKNSATYKNLPYSSEYSRSKLDLWAPNSRELSPLVVFFHSGGLTHGSRDSIPFKEIFLNLSSRGIAFASIGYPILGDLGEKYSAEEDSRNFIRNHTLKAINFLKSNSVKFKLDPTRLVLAGSSSGCIIAEYLALVKKVPARGVLCFDQPTRSKFILNYFKKPFPPIYFYTRAGPEDLTHHANNAREVFNKCLEAGGGCKIFGGPKNSLSKIPKGENFVLYSLSEILF